jgi:sulfur-oxidizing protein SoxY
MKAFDASGGWSRRNLIGVGAALVGAMWIRPSHAAGPDLASALAAFASNTPIKPGRVQLDVAPLVENGNTVPVKIAVQSPMTEADHVVAIAIFNEKNPQRDVGIFRLGARAGRAEISTRIRLATSQKLVAVAQMSDGTYWSHSVDVIVTLAACVEPG